MDDKKQEVKRGVHIDTNPTQIVVIGIMFVTFFVLPIVASKYFETAREGQVVDETYTEAALEQQKRDVDREGSVAGISDARVDEVQEGNIRLPIINKEISKDLSEPGTMAFAVGGIFGVVSIVLLISIFFDFWRT